MSSTEYAEYFYGAALVACQPYAVGTVSDINEIRASLGLSKLRKMELYKSNGISTLRYTFVELINSLANLFKHNQEWDIWPDKENTRTLRYFGIDEKTEFPLNTGISIILCESSDLRRLCETLENWRFFLIHEQYRNA